MPRSYRPIAYLRTRVVQTNPEKLEAARRGGRNRASYYGSASMSAAGKTGGIVKFLKYGSVGMSAMISKFWEQVRAGERPAPRRGR